MPSPTDKQVTPPYVTYRTFVNSLLKLRERGLPARIDSSVFSNLSNSGIAALIAAYKYLGLVGENSAPTDRLRELVGAEDAKRAELIKDLVIDRYQFLQAPNLDLSSATTQQVETAFREQGIKGSTITKAVSFFLSAATEGGIQISSHIKPPSSPKRNGVARPKRPKNSAADRKQSEQGQTGTGTPPQKSAAEMLLAKFPEFDPSWPAEIKSAWFESFSSLRGAMLKEDT